ncbi:hypothetical protein ACJRO7_009747 [Eucalyptus globulus]|uniref:Heparanase-like protein 1 n=1 Tax=Eucalyptus globulus TaxID=34317 RepID=A0ABD3LAK8_EUCGL
MGLSCLALFIFIVSFPWGLAQDVARSTLIIHGSEAIAETDDNFICATLDWWPHDKCNYDQCPWGYSSVINLNLSHPVLGKAIQAFKSLRIRIGGSLQDRVLYDVGQLGLRCQPFRKIKGSLFGFSKGCLHMKRWDELNNLFSKTGAIVTFGLNALNGRHWIKDQVWGGDWNFSNAYDFIKYTVARGYSIDSWEFGNELSGSGVDASVSVEQYGKDLIFLKNIINELYKSSRSKPSVIAPGGFYDQQWYAKLLQVSGSGLINAMSHHIYNLGGGDDPHLVSKILDPSYLSQISDTFINLEETIKKHGPWASAWVGESGGAYNSGGRHISNTFINSFWYLDQLGMASKYDTKVYCRQSLVGGNYGLLNTTTLVPNPDYYSALLWHRLMGKRALAVSGDAPPSLRCYAHCLKGRAGVTLLLINLRNQTKFIITTQNSVQNLHVEEPSVDKGSILIHGLKKTVSFVGQGPSRAPLFREEYHLTPQGGHLQSQTMLLNGSPLELTRDGAIPPLKPNLVHADSLISVSPLSIAFIVLPNFDVQACA